VVRGCGS
jgi:hypothetical protein